MPIVIETLSDVSGFYSTHSACDDEQREWVFNARGIHVISFAVVGHEARIVQATDLAHQLGAIITVDDGTAGVNGNHLKAWDITSTLDSTWAAVVEDDAIPVPDFLNQAEQALAVAPAPVVSFYLGRARPKRWQQERIAPAIAKAERYDTHWLTCTHLLHAVAVAMRTELVDEWLQWAHTSTLPIDERITAWCIAHDHKIAYSWPSICDHADGATLIDHTPTADPRIAWRTGTRDTWTSTATPM
jgi:hypothetical protein